MNGSAALTVSTPTNPLTFKIKTPSSIWRTRAQKQIKPQMSKKRSIKLSPATSTTFVENRDQKSPRPNSGDEGLSLPHRGTTTIHQHSHTDLLRVKHLSQLFSPTRSNGRSRNKLLSKKTVHLSALGCRCLSFGGNNFSTSYYSLNSGKSYQHVPFIAFHYFLL
jgi:hypothetical protein